MSSRLCRPHVPKRTMRLRSVEQLLIALLLISHCASFHVRQCNPNHIPEDGKLNFTQLASKYGLLSEEHVVTTEDGYILKLFHIPGNRTRPILLMHGVLDSADTYIIRGNGSMVMALARAGYDVWVGNKRGNRYSRRHRHLNPDADKKFWDFSFHENGFYDLPATIDYILDRTNQKQLTCIGHSQGNTIFYVLGAMRPEYNEKVKLLIAMAPICYLHNLRSPARDIVQAWPFMDKLFSFIGKDEIFSQESLESNVLKSLCTLKGSYEICGKGFLLKIAGVDTEELEPDFVPVVISHYPSGSSRKSGTHLLQLGLNKDFSQMDYGFQKNLAVYNSVTPPRYDLKKVTMRVALVAASNDGMCSLTDVKILKSRLPNVVAFRVLDWSRFNHIDYVWGRHMDKHLFPYVFSLLEQFGG